MWKICVEDHSFFRLLSPDKQEKPKFPRFGSRYTIYLSRYLCRYISILYPSSYLFSIYLPFVYYLPTNKKNPSSPDLDPVIQSIYLSSIYLMKSKKKNLCISTRYLCPLLWYLFLYLDSVILEELRRRLRSPLPLWSAPTQPLSAVGLILREELILILIILFLANLCR